GCNGLRDQKAHARGGQSKSNNDCEQILLHCNSRCEDSLETSFSRVVCLLRFEDRVTLYVHPVGWLRWKMPTQAVFFLIRCYPLSRRIGFVQGPSPSITPQRIAGIASLVVLDHDEPHFRSRSPMCVPRRQLRVIGRKDLFH